MGVNHGLDSQALGSGRKEVLLDVLWQDGERRYSRMWRDTGSGDGGGEVLVAQPCAEHPTTDTVSRLAHEYSLRDYLDHSWAVRPLELVRERGQTMLLLQPTRARPLYEMLGPGLTIGAFLRVAIAVTNAVTHLHQSGLIHKDIKASNILIDPESGDAQLIGFGIASRLPRERQTIEPPEFIAGTLSHMAPEQTGRMNRSIDSRSDLYSLGITFYHALTGSLPFNAHEPLEWVHCHVARKPSPPKAGIEEIPPQLGAIIMKLLAKTPEERYQTGAAVERDLRRCRDDWETQGAIDEFSLGEGDQSDRLLIPEKLYGRDREIATLLAAFDAAVASAKPQLVLVSGYSGIGKSSLVGELHKALVPSRGLFASGKFDQLKRDVPYATLAQAVQSLIRQLLSKPDAELNQWREQLCQALNPNGALVVDLIPELKFVIGEQPPVPDVPPAAANARVQNTLRRLIGVFARAEHPLALFFDDLQWLDGATLDLLENILTQPEPQPLLLVGAYRDNETDAAHPLTRKLSAIRASGAVVHEVVLGPLEHQDLTHWFADALRCPHERALPLAQLVHEKTGGNPFFASQFLQELVEDDLISFEPSEGSWRWDLGPMRAKGYTDNVVDLMVGKLSRLPRTTQEALSTLACLGNTGNTSTLALVHGTSEEQLHSDLWEALRLELIVRSDDSYRFVHDRVQEAAYSLIPEAQRAPEHLRIGRLLTTQLAPDKPEQAVFEIVGHFNRATALITSPEEREQVAALNLLAGKRAKKAAAFASALSYLTAGAALVADEGSQRHDLVFELELHRAECEFLTGEVAAAEQRLRTLSSRAQTVVERAAVVCLQADIYFALQQHDRGLEEGVNCLRQGGLDIPLHPTELEARAAYNRVLSKLEGVGIDEVGALPLMSDPTSRAIFDVLAKISSTASVVGDNFQILIASNAIDLTLQKGIHDGSCFAFVWLGYVAGWLYGSFDASFRFGQLGYELIERKGLRRFEGYVCLIFSTMMMPWAKHVLTCRPVIDRTFEVSQNTGDHVWAVASRNILLSNLLLAGDALGDVDREAEGSLAFCKAAAFADYTDTVATQAALVRSLRGLTLQFGSFDDERFDERRMESHFATQPHAEAIECWYWIRKLQARFLAGDYAVALESSRRAQGLLAKSPGMLERAEHELYSGLTHAALCDSASSDERRQHLEAMIGHQRQLETWAHHCPENFENRAALLAAEIACVEERDSDAARLYEQAIRSARENGFVHNEGLAYECASAHYRARGFDQFAELYLRNARACYVLWGADGKVSQLDQLFPNLKQEERTRDPTPTITALVEGLDLATLITVSQTVSGEIVLEKLLDTVMRKAMEHAGADRGLLILQSGDQLQIRAEATTGEDAVLVRAVDETISSATVPESILRYVARTREQVIIDDVSVSNPFSTDEYLREKRTCSVLCLPLLKQGELVALLYLENKLASNVFTPARLKILEVLASQAAISLENSRLYHEVQRAEEAVRRSEKQLSDVIETMPAIAFTLLPDGSPEFVNRRFTEYTGLNAEEVGLYRRKTIHPDDIEGYINKWQASLTSGEPFENEVRHRGADGQYRWFLVRGVPLRNEHGTILKWFGTLTDIEDRKQAEERLRNENVVLREDIVNTSMFEEIVGTSVVLQGVLAQVAKVAPTDSTVLITGETGTGKELVARAIHKKSQRSGLAFVAVNCAAIPRELIASELFGHEKGAFTGATQQRLGRFELASGGTIFLDEVGELPAETQIALLRVLQEREFERVGGTRQIRADVRVIAATNRDLQAAIRVGSFRSDLFYRLLVFPIKVPSLRERREDIPLLVEYFIERYARKAGKNIRGVDKKTLELLQSYPWPGNIRELQNVIERSLILCETEIFSIDKSWLPQQAFLTEPENQTELSLTLLAQEKKMIEAALQECRGRVFGPSGAAARLGIPRSTLESKIRALKIDKNRFKASDPL